MEDFNWLQDMIADDDSGLLKVKKKTSALTADEQLVSKFNEINNFVVQHGRVPANKHFGVYACEPFRSD